MRTWVPVPGTAKERLVRGALQEFGSRGFDAVNVNELARDAEVTIGSLYHHFGSKHGLYEVVRTDVERRVIDRMEGAAAVRDPTSAADITAVLLVGFDYLVGAGYARMLSEPHPDARTGVPNDQLADLFARLADRDGAPMGTLLLAAWRAALRVAAGDGADAADARRALAGFLIG